MQNSIHDVKITGYKDGMIKCLDGDYVDFTSGIFAASLGLYNSYISEVLYCQSILYMHTYTMGSSVRDKYLKDLADFTGYESAYMFSSGTEATEAAWKIARRITGKDGIWCLPGAFHGKTLGAQIAAGRIADRRSQTLGEKTGCLIFEPYQALTAALHPPDIIERIKRLQKEYGLILIADEIQGGFYRTGKLFGFQHYPGLKPDLVCVGKAAFNGFPASAVLGPSFLIDNPGMELSSTNGGSPLACAVGSEVIQQMSSIHFHERLSTLCKRFEEEIKSLPIKTNVIGMVAALMFDKIREADEMVLKLRDNGILVVHTGKNTIKLGPPLNMPLGTFSRGIDIIKKTIKETV